MKIKKQLKLFPKKEKYFKCSCGDSRCGKLCIIDFGDGECEIGFVKYPNRKKPKGAIVLSVEEKNRLIKYLKSLK